MKAIWKFPLGAPRGVNEVQMPKGAQVLCAQLQDEVPCLWAMVESEAQMEERVFMTYGTGHHVSRELKLEYVDTYQLLGGQLVFHVFERKRS